MPKFLTTFQPDLVEWLKSRPDVQLPDEKLLRGFTISCEVDSAPRITFDTFVLGTGDKHNRVKLDKIFDNEVTVLASPTDGNGIQFREWM